MKDGGVALMSNGYGEGEGRLQQAIDQALSSPLLNNNDVYNAQLYCSIFIQATIMNSV